MDQSSLNTGSQFSQPIRQIISLLIVAGLSGLGVVIAAPSVWPVFASNIYLNGAILFVFAIGVISCFAQVVQLVFSVRWLESFAGEKEKGAKGVRRWCGFGGSGCRSVQGLQSPHQLTWNRSS